MPLLLIGCGLTDDDLRTARVHTARFGESLDDFETADSDAIVNIGGVPDSGSWWVETSERWRLSITAAGRPSEEDDVLQPTVFASLIVVWKPDDQSAVPFDSSELDGPDCTETLDDDLQWGFLEPTVLTIRSSGDNDCDLELFIEIFDLEND